MRIDVENSKCARTCTESPSWVPQQQCILLQPSIVVTLLSEQPSECFNHCFKATKFLFLLSQQKQSQSAYIWWRNESKCMLYHFGASERHFSAIARFGARQARLKGRWPPYDLYIHIYISRVTDARFDTIITVGLAGARPNISQKHNVLSPSWVVLVFSGWTYFGHAFFGVRSYCKQTHPSILVHVLFADKGLAVLRWCIVPRGHPGDVGTWLNAHAPLWIWFSFAE